MGHSRGHTASWRSAGSLGSIAGAGSRRAFRKPFVSFLTRRYLALRRIARRYIMH